MLKAINVIAITLLVALVSVVPASLLGPYLPGYLDLGLKRIAVAAWISALIGWWVARAVARNEQEARQEAAKKSSSNPKAVGITVAFLAVAICVAVLLHFYGADLLSWTGS